MPSRREGLPLVAVEAASMARPVIATRAGGLADLIVDGDTGLFVDGDDPEMWASAIARVIENRALASAMGARARARVQSLADWTSVVDAYHGVYRSLTAGASKRERV